MRHWTEQISCPDCGGELDIYDKYYTDEGIRVTCFDCGFRRWFKDMEDIRLFFFPHGMPSNLSNKSSNRTRAWRRRKNVTKALRKLNITKHYWSFDSHPYYSNLHQYSKNKIHCSCPMCSAKTRNKGRRSRKNYHPAINYKPSDLRRQKAMDQDEADFSSDLD